MPIAGDCVTLSDYRTHLRMLHAWLVPITAHLARHTDGPQGSTILPPSDYLAAIEADLADLPADLEAMPVTDVAFRTDPAYRWGLCYVIEGSQLGGAVLYRRLAATLAPHPLRYLRGQDAGPGPRWQHFIRALRAHVNDETQIDSACRGAMDAFDSLLAILGPVPATQPA
jgi:heme oxygenase